jgi:hypothetical protein
MTTTNKLKAAEITDRDVLDFLIREGIDWTSLGIVECIAERVGGGVNRSALAKVQGILRRLVAEGSVWKIERRNAPNRYSAEWKLVEEWRASQPTPTFETADEVQARQQVAAQKFLASLPTSKPVDASDLVEVPRRSARGRAVMPTDSAFPWRLLNEEQRDEWLRRESRIGNLEAKRVRCSRLRSRVEANEGRFLEELRSTSALEFHSGRTNPARRLLAGIGRRRVLAGIAREILEAEQRRDRELELRDELDRLEVEAGHREIEREHEEHERGRLAAVERETFGDLAALEDEQRDVLRDR